MGSFHLFPEQKRCFGLLDGYLTLAGYWLREERRYLEIELKEALTVLSRGEKIMAQCFYSVLIGNDSVGFRLVEAASTLDDQDLDTITD